MKQHPYHDLIFVCLTMLTVGVVMAETGASLAQMGEALALTGAQQGNLVSARFVGGVALGFVLWIQPGTINLKRWFLAAMALIVVTVPLLLVPRYEAALAAAILRGLAAGIVIPASGMYAATQHRWRPGVVAGVVNATLSSGLVLVSLVAIMLNRAGTGRWELYWALGPLLALPSLVAGAGARMATETGENDTAGEPGAIPELGATADLGATPDRAIGTAPEPNPIRALVTRTSWIIATAGLLVVGSESVLLGLIPAISANRAPVLGGEAYALLLMSGVLIGRLVGSMLFRYLRAVHVFAVSAIAIAAVGGAWATGFAVPLAVFAWGVATASLFPGLVGVTSEVLTTRAGTTMAAIGWMGGIGGTLVPAVAGRIAGTSPLAMLFVAVPAILAMVLGVSARRLSRGAA